MSHLKAEQLYPLMYALRRHARGDETIADLELPTELTRLLARMARDRGAPPLLEPETPLSPKRVGQIVLHITECAECQMLVYETGSAARRPPTAAELKAEELAALANEHKLKRNFCIHAVLAFVCFIAGYAVLSNYYNRPREQAAAGPVLTTNEAPKGMHPQEMAGLALLMVTAYSVASGWMIANTLWLDYTRMKRAVPFIGKRWAERSRKRVRK
ncbi:MAG: hypothetical protein ACKVX7_06855 [Planctomycetota bacterium]